MTCNECGTPLSPKASGGLCPRHLDTARKRRSRAKDRNRGPAAPRVAQVVNEAAAQPSGKVTVNSDGGTFEGVTTDRPLETATDWAAVFARFNLDPAVFEIVDDTVSMSMSTWQQSKRLENGDRDTVDLYAYKYAARFRRRSTAALPADVVAQWREVLLRDGHVVEAPRLGRHGTYLLLVADPQLGKKGTGQAQANWRAGVLGHVAAIRRLISAGRSPEAIHVAYQGDETEGVANNYTNQPHTIELNQAEQLTADYELRVWTLRQVAALGLPISASSVVSNHGEWTRNGGKDPITKRSDNASTFIARQVKALFDELAPFTGWNVEWTIGDGGQPGVTVGLSGIDCYFSHGYVEKGKGSSSESRVKAAIERQILGSTERLGTTALWFMAHYHHFHAQEFEGRTLFGCPALEALRSSEYMLDQFGVWSPPGMLGLVVDASTARGWSDLAVY